MRDRLTATKDRLLDEPGRFRDARIWSNRVIRAIGPLFDGVVINVSGWQDLDKQGGRYRDYFPNASRYLVSNHRGTRGLDDGMADREIDLTSELPQDLQLSVDTCFNHTTLEHIFEVGTAFRNLCLMARQSVIVVVPFVQEQHYTDDYGDFWRFTPQALQRLAKDNGFATVGVTWNNVRNRSTYIVYVCAREPSHLTPVAELMAIPDQHPGEWVGRTRRRVWLLRLLKWIRMAVARIGPRVESGRGGRSR